MELLDRLTDVASQGNFSFIDPNCMANTPHEILILIVPHHIPRYFSSETPEPTNF